MLASKRPCVLSVLITVTGIVMSPIETLPGGPVLSPLTVNVQLWGTAARASGATPALNTRTPMAAKTIPAKAEVPQRAPFPEGGLALPLPP